MTPGKSPWGFAMAACCMRFWQTCPGSFGIWSARPYNYMILLLYYDNHIFLYDFYSYITIIKFVCILFL